MSEGASINSYLKSAFDFEIRNKIETRLRDLNEIEDPNEKESDELNNLELIKEYLLKRIGEMKT